LRTRLRDSGLIIALLALGFLFFGPVLRLTETELLIGTDLHWLFLPTTTFAFTAFRAGELPLWNPQLFLGFPQFAEPQLSTFYPLLWLFAGWPAAQAFSWLYAIHFGLAAAGGYVLTRQWGGRWAGSLVTGLVLGFGAFMTAHVYAGHLPHVMTIAYLPWLLAGAGWAIRSRPFLATLLATMLAALPLALAMLAGYAPFFPLLVGAVSVYLFWEAALALRQGDRRGAGRILLQWMGLGLFAGLLTAVQLLPTAQFTLLSSRVATADYAFAGQFAMPIWQLLTLVAPDLFGIPDWYPLPLDKAPYWAITYPPTYWEAALYVGILPLLLAGWAWLGGKRAWRFWGFWGLAGLILAWGAEGAWHRIFYQVIPGFGLFRVPARLAYFFVLATAVLAGLAFDHWFNLSADRFQGWKTRLQRTLGVFLPALLLLSLVGVMGQAGQTAVAQQLRLQGVTEQIVRLAFLLTLSLALLMAGYGRPRWQLALAAMIILVLDLWGYGGKFVATHEMGDNAGWSLADAALPGERHTYRVLSSGLPQNLAALYGFQHLSGYDDFRLETGLRLEELAEKDVRIAQLLGVRFHVHDPAVGGLPETTEGWRYFTMLGELPVFEQVGALPRAFIVHDVIGAADAVESLRLIGQPEIDFGVTAVVQIQPDTQCVIEPGEPGQDAVSITRYTPDEVVLQVEAQSTGWLVLADLYYPGWAAEVNGRSVPIQPTNYGLRGICVPEGSHEIRFVFQPPILRVGMMVSGTAVALLLITLLTLAVTRLRHRGHVMSKTQFADYADYAD
jgi:hypothetical protein